MKKILGLIAVAALLFAGCNSNSNIQVVDISVYSSDSLVTVDTHKSVFSSGNSKLDNSLNDLNDSIDLFYNKANDEIREWAEKSAEFIHEGMNYELMMEDSLFYSSSDFISLRIMKYMYTGGAHGNAFYTAINYDPQTRQFLTTANIINANNHAEVNKLIAQHFKNDSGCFWEQPKVENASAINISRNLVTFIYDHYVLGAYACGPAIVDVPLEEMQPYMLLKLVQ